MQISEKGSFGDARRAEVSVADQRLLVLEGLEEIVSYPVSTSKFGLGSEEGSHKTPLGEFEVGEKIGAGEPLRTVFRSRLPVGVHDPRELVDGDMVLSRILWLHGLEEGNANTRERYIYIHGTNQEAEIGEPASIGCVRMRNEDVVELFELLDVGVRVSIVE
jgi:lipoprotein-anchoring transpeptidase ErfK/SrfK